MNPIQWFKIYDLRDDKRTIQEVQSATLDTDYAGLKPTFGLFGSQEWWDAIARGDIPKRIIEGTISKVYMGGHDDYPLFDVMSNGERTGWTREGDDRYYVVGGRVRITYVLQEPKASPPSGPESVRAVLSIEIER